MAETYKAVADKNFEEVKSLCASNDGWTRISAESDTEVFEKPIGQNPINCFKALGVVNKSPKDLAELLWNGTEERWKLIDNSLVSWRVVEEINQDQVIITQVNKLPWPLWSRDMVLVRTRYEENGVYYITLKSVEHPKVPLDTANYVRANIVISAFVFEPVGAGQSKVTRILLVDPAGNIPAAVVNMNAKATNAVILWLRANA